MSNFNYHVRLGTMHCISTEDVTGNDDIIINVDVDGTPHGTEIRWEDVSNGDHHFFGNVFEFNNSLKFTVTEEDLIDLNDDIGEITINASNINDEFIQMDPFGLGNYSLAWSNLSDHRDEIENNHGDMMYGKPSYDDMVNYDDNIASSEALQGHRNIHEHLNEENREKETYKALMSTVHTYKRTEDPTERRQAVENLKTELGYNPLRGIVNEIDDGNWPSIVVFGLVSPVDFGFASFNLSYGLAISDNYDAKFCFAFGLDVGWTIGDEGKIGIGINRNEPENVPGYTYYYTAASYELTGGITFSFDAVPDSPNLQEVLYTYGEFPAADSVGYEFTVGIG